MSNPIVKYYCTSCKSSVKETDLFCPYCGGEKKEIKMSIKDHLQIYNQIRTKNKRRILGKNKVVYEEKLGDDYYRKMGKWNFLHRIIDRLNDRYYKLIKDGETGEVIRKTDEKLSKHQGYGSAKHNKKE